MTAITKRLQAIHTRLMLEWYGVRTQIDELAWKTGRLHIEGIDSLTTLIELEDRLDVLGKEREAAWMAFKKAQGKYVGA